MCTIGYVGSGDANTNGPDIILDLVKIEENTYGYIGNTGQNSGEISMKEVTFEGNVGGHVGHVASLEARNEDIRLKQEAILRGGAASDD
jgi:hypothetical protein